jgi:cytochrome oxidase Cu insertion factor (SCO1/SenC/PrrC family)
MMRFRSALIAAAALLTSSIVQAQGAEAPEEMQGTVNVGDKALGFTLKDQNGREHSLESLLDADGYLALVFYRSADW